MKILHIAECVGGVERYLKNYICFSEADNELVLSQLYDVTEYKDKVSFAANVYMPHGISVGSFFSALQVRKIIKERKPDVVFAHSSIAGAIARIACLGLRCKVFYNPHGWAFNMESKHRKMYVFLEKVMAHFCDAIICISEAEKESAIRNRICKEKKLYVVYNGINLEEKTIGSITREKLNIQQSSFVVGMVGRICKQKAPEVFVKMAVEINRKIKDSVFIIVGDVLEGAEEERKEIEEYAQKNNVNLIITGWVDNPLDYIDVFDVACLLSRWEGFGLAIPEYMYCNKPIVATKVDAIPFLISDEKNGLLIERDDYVSAAEAVLRLRNDKAFAEKIVENAKETVFSRFDASRVPYEIETLMKCNVNMD